MEFYTYLWLRVDGTPYYAGKGKGSRAFKTDDHGVKCPKDLSRIIVQPQPSEEAAFAVEKFLIEYYGRLDLGTGCLRNLTSGGDGIAGFRFSEDQKRTLSESHKGLVRSETHRQNLAKALTGKKASAETRRKQSEAAKRRLLTLEGQLNASKAGKLGAAARWGDHES
jgi:hypothetical protein